MKKPVRYDYQLGFRITRAMHDKLERQAAKHKQPLSEYVRDVLKRHLGEK